MAGVSSKLKWLAGVLVFVISALTFLFYRIQEKLTFVLLPNDISNITQTPLDDTSEKNHKTPLKKEEKITPPSKSTLTWSEFSAAFQRIESKRQAVFVSIAQQLSHFSTEEKHQSLKIISMESVFISDEGSSWDKVIQRWQQLDKQQQRFIRSLKVE